MGLERGCGPLRAVKQEVVEVLPAVAFFWVVFNLMRWIESLFLAETGIKLGSFVNASIAALVVGKVLLVIDLFPGVNAFGGRPLIYNTLWKTLLYSTGALLFRSVEELAPLAMETGGVAAGFERFVAEVQWTRFWAIQAFIAMMLLIFVGSRELIRAVGTSQVRQLFFGR